MACVAVGGYGLMSKLLFHYAAVASLQVEAAKTHGDCRVCTTTDCGECEQASEGHRYIQSHKARPKHA